MRAPTTPTFCRATPAAVQDEAKRIYAEATPYVAARVKRLAEDGRMNAVWRKLRPYYKDAALVSLFNTAATETRRLFHSKKAALKASKQCVLMFTRLRKLADLLERHPELQVFGSDLGADPDVLRGAAEIYTVLMDRNMYFSTERYKKIGDPEARDLAFVLSGHMEMRFGKPFDAIVADIINVVLDRAPDRRIGAHTVKYWRTGS